MKLPKKPDDEIGFQLAPMIDMTFLLLIFFMVTTKISKEQLKMDVKLPTATSAVLPKDHENRDTVAIDHLGQYFVGQRQVNKKELTEYLKQRFENYPPLRLYIRADAGTPAKQIKELMRIASEAGALNIIFGTYQK